MELFERAYLEDVANRIMKNAISNELKQNKDLEMALNKHIRNMRFKYTIYFVCSLFLPFICFFWISNFICGLVLLVFFCREYIKNMQKTKERLEIVLKKARKNPNVTVELIITNFM